MNRHSIYTLICAGVLFMMLAAGCSGATASPTPTLPPTATHTAIPPSATPVPPTATAMLPDQKMAPELIAFVSIRDGNQEIYTIKPDGSQETRLTKNPNNDIEPVWSPDGKHIAFTRLPSDKEYGEAGDIWVMKADGSGATRLTQDESINVQPRWSPDSRRIAFISNAFDPSAGVFTSESFFGVFVVDVYSTDLRRLTKGFGPDYLMADANLTTNRNWSPDGQSIIYVECSDNSCSIFGIKPDPRGRLDDLEYFLTQALSANDPTWSPDGKKIAFDGPADCQDCGYEIYLMNADGSGLEILTDDPVDDWNPVWSPDGSKLAYVSGRGDEYDIYVLDLTSRKKIQLTDTPGFELQPTWSPDGKWVAFVAERDGNTDIYVTDLEDKQFIRVTTDPATDGFPCWSPAIQ